MNGFWQRLQPRKRVQWVVACAAAAFALLTRGHRPESDRAPSDLKARYAAGFSFQIAYAGRFDNDQVYRALDRCCENRGAGLTRLSIDPMLERLPGAPRFAAMVGKVGFSEAR